MRRQTRTQQQRTTVLFVTNGEKTEQQYLSLLKDAVHQKHGKKYSVTVKLIEGGPSTVLGKLTNPLGDASGYDQVWLVVDKDDFTLEKFLAECREEDVARQKQNARNEKKGQNQAGTERLFRAVVSNPCFEVWLAAYYGKIRHYQHQEEAKRHYEKSAGLAKGAKDLPGGIQMNNLATQSANAKLSGSQHKELNAEREAPGTAVPNMLSFYGLV